jgi:hypothetical protein
VATEYCTDNQKFSLMVIYIENGDALCDFLVSLNSNVQITSKPWPFSCVEQVTTGLASFFNA